MLEAGCRLGLTDEARQHGRSAAQDAFESHEAIRASLPGLVDDRHAAAPQLSQDLVALDLQELALVDGRLRLIHGCRVIERRPESFEEAVRDIVVLLRALLALRALFEMLTDLAQEL